MREQTDVRLRILSQTLTPQDIEARIGLKPSESWRIGDRLGAFGAAARDHGFVIESGALASAPFREYVAALIRKIAPAAQKIGALGDQCVIEVVCTLHRKAAPLLTFERDDIRWIGVMGAKLRVDTFVISDGPRGGDRASFGGPGGAGGEETPKL
ncbi:MAG: DUF4279 domain-containing protein [Elusimicrobia bacterium]|nr:DUF4279 domain-containing protein [Elusimicrobiota bacterium]